MQIGFIGLGNMGSRMAEKILEGGHSVVAWNRTNVIATEFNQEMINKNPGSNLIVADTVKELVEKLTSPKVIWLMLPAGEATEVILQQVAEYVGKNDVVIDGGNSNFKDTQRRFEQFEAKGIRYLGIGVSGGIIAATNGYPLMVGGDQSAYHYIEPVLKTLAKPKGGYEFFGEGGAGHFVKMVHNAIEYSYMQGIGEGFGVLQKAQYYFDLGKVANLYSKNTLISGFMMDRTIEVLQADPTLADIVGVIGSASKETVWTIEEAKKQGVPIENIEQAYEFRVRSETDLKIQQSFAAKLVGALRIAFGGHKVKKK